MKKEILLAKLAVLFGTNIFSQTNIVVENANINNTTTYYGASNSITSPSAENKPVNITTGNKTVEFKSGNNIILKPGFHATAQTGGNFKTIISPGFTVTTDPNALQPNDFRIGMFGFKYIDNGLGKWYDPPSGNWYLDCSLPNNPNGPVSSSTTLINGQTGYSSQLNVLKEDGFNTVLQYGWPGGGWGSGSRIANQLMLDLVKNNGLQFVADGRSYWRPDVTGFSGTNIYNGDNGFNAGFTTYSPASPCRARADYNDLIDNLFSQSNYKSTVWGYQMTEEFSHAQPANSSMYPQCWMECDPWKIRWIDGPASNVASAIGYFRNRLTNQGAGNQKLMVMDAYHWRSINDNSQSDNTTGPNPTITCTNGCANPQTLQANVLQGYSQPQDYVNSSLMGSNMPDVFFEGSYWDNGLLQTWNSNPYSNIYNNANHYLGVFKSIDYVYSKGVKEVHKVIGNEGANVSYPYSNGNGLWFQAYNSIIHGAKGIWFWNHVTDDGYNISDPNDVTAKAGMLDPNNPARFERINFPMRYQYYTRYLAKELAYFVGKNLLSTDPKTILYTKTDGLDPNCIVPPGTVPYFGDPNTEAYSLRYTIRTNGPEVIMIISNPLPAVINNITLDFDKLTNPIIKSAGGVDVLFGDPYISVDAPSYKTNRSNTVDLSTLTISGDDSYYIPFLPNKKLQISFGPLDIKILRFVTSPQTPLVDLNNDWNKIWTNGGKNAIDSWLLRGSDHLISGDFNGDTDDELLCTQQVSNYATMLDFDSGNWKTIWSNNGSGSVGTYTLGNIDYQLSGDFDGDGKDELLVIAQDMPPYYYRGIAKMFKYENNNWTATWENTSSNGYIGVFQMRLGDVIFTGDFDGDKKDELFCINNYTRIAVMQKYVNGVWQVVWSNNGSGYIDNWLMENTPQYNPSKQYYRVADLNNDGLDDIITFDANGSFNAEVLRYVPIGNDPSYDPLWKYSNSQLSGIPNWQNDLFTLWFGNPPPSSIMTGNIDFDGKAELLYFSENASGGGGKSGEYVDDNSFIINWNVNYSTSSYLDDWYLYSNPQSKYMLIKPDKYSPKMVLALVGDDQNCVPYLASMYRSIDGTNKRIVTHPEPTTSSGSENTLQAEGLIDNISLYPNPTAGTFSIAPLVNEIPIIEVRIYDLLGGTVTTRQVGDANSLTFNLSDHGKGVYFVKVTLKDGTVKIKKVAYQ